MRSEFGAVLGLALLAGISTVGFAAGAPRMPPIPATSRPIS